MEEERAMTEEEMNAVKLQLAKEREQRRKMRVLDKLLIKIGTVYTDFYLFKHGYIVSGTSDTSCMIRITNPEYMQYFKDCFGEFSILHIKDSKGLKKYLVENATYDEVVAGFAYEDHENYHHTDYFEEVTTPSLRQGSEKLLQKFQDRINEVVEWADFSSFVTEVGEEKFNRDFYGINSSIEFHPKDNPDSPYVILTKSYFPLMDMKNYQQLHYSSLQVNSDLYNILFHLEYELFDLYMMYYYIQIDD